MEILAEDGEIVDALEFFYRALCRLLEVNFWKR